MDDPVFSTRIASLFWSIVSCWRFFVVLCLLTFQQEKQNGKPGGSVRELSSVYIVLDRFMPVVLTHCCEVTWSSTCPYLTRTCEAWARHHVTPLIYNYTPRYILLANTQSTSLVRLISAGLLSSNKRIIRTKFVFELFYKFYRIFKSIRQGVRQTGFVAKIFKFGGGSLPFCHRFLGKNNKNGEKWRSIFRHFRHNGKNGEKMFAIFAIMAKMARKSMAKMVNLFAISPWRKSRKIIINGEWQWAPQIFSGQI